MCKTNQNLTVFPQINQINIPQGTTTSRRRTTRPYHGEAGYRSIERDEDRERLFR